MVPTWTGKMGEHFALGKILIRLEKSLNFTQNTGTSRNFDSGKVREICQPGKLKKTGNMVPYFK